MTFSDLNSISIEDGTLLKGRSRDAYELLDQNSVLTALFDLVSAGFDNDLFQSSADQTITDHESSRTKKKKKKNTQQFSRKYLSYVDEEPIPSHFPPMPPEHSYLTTKV